MRFTTVPGESRNNVEPMTEEEPAAGAAITNALVPGCSKYAPALTGADATADPPTCELQLIHATEPAGPCPRRAVIEELHTACPMVSGSVGQVASGAWVLGAPEQVSNPEPEAI